MKRAAILATFGVALVIASSACAPPGGENCDRFVAPGASFSGATSGAQAGDHICLASGSYAWGNYSPPANVTIEALPGDAAIITGQARVSNNGVTLENLTLREPTNIGGGHAVVFLTGNDFLASHLDVDGQHQDTAQGFLIGSNAGARPVNPRIVDTKIHAISNAARADRTHFHAIYCEHSSGGEFARLWMYDIQGFGFHFYGDCTNVNAHNSVYDDGFNHFGHVIDTFGPIPTGIKIHDNVLTDSGPITCRVQGAGNSVDNNRVQSGIINCPGSGNQTTDTAYQNEAGRDYRVPGDSRFQYIPGPR